MGTHAADVVLSAETLEVAGRSGELCIRVRTPAGERLIEGTDLLVAAGLTVLFVSEPTHAA